MSRDKRADYSECYSSKGTFLGLTITGGAISGVDASFSKVKDEGTTETTTHTGTTVTASDTLTMQSGNDTTITGSQVGGKTVKVDVGGNLNITSLQDTETYRGDSSSMGGGISVSLSSGSKKEWLDDSLRKYDPTPYVPGTTSGSAFLGKGSMDSDYASVTQQAGIYAGEGGFTVHVEDNTRLTGSLLDSTASEDKNSLTTGTLTMEDMGNKAEYDVKNIGVSYTHYGTDAEKYKHYNESGLVPDLMPGAEDEASSTTHSAIAPGTITTTKEKTDLSQINRDTANALNKLNHIFDKKTIEEKQELAKLFAKNGNELIHKVSEYYGWADSDANKVALHFLLGGLTAQIAGGDFSSGAWAAGVNEQLSREILKLADGDPAKAQLYSAFVGMAVNSLTTENIETGAATSQFGMKWNELAQYTQIQSGEVHHLGREAIEHGLIPNPRSMKSDYVYLQVGVGALKFLSVSGGVIMDRNGNLYGFVQGDIGAGISTPVFGGYGQGTIETKWLRDNDNDLINAIRGTSSGISGGAVVSASVSKGSDGGAITIEIGVSTSAGTTYSSRRAVYLCNIYEI